MTFPSWAGGKRARIANAVLAAIFTILVATSVGPLLTSVWAQTPEGTSQEPSTSIGQKAASHMQPRPTTVLGWHFKNSEHWPPDPDLNNCHLKFNRAHSTTSSIVNLTITDRRGATHFHSPWSILTSNETAWSPISQRNEIHSIPTVSGMRCRLKIRSTGPHSLLDRFSSPPTRTAKPITNPSQERRNPSQTPHKNGETHHKPLTRTAKPLTNPSQERRNPSQTPHKNGETPHKTDKKKLFHHYITSKRVMANYGGFGYYRHWANAAQTNKTYNARA
jgi:hypothetical protein